MKIIKKRANYIIYQYILIEFSIIFKTIVISKKITFRLLNEYNYKKNNFKE